MWGDRHGAVSSLHTNIIVLGLNVGKFSSISCHCFLLADLCFHVVPTLFFCAGLSQGIEGLRFVLFTL